MQKADLPVRVTDLILANALITSGVFIDEEEDKTSDDCEGLGDDCYGWTRRRKNVKAFLRRW